MKSSGQYENMFIIRKMISAAENNLMLVLIKKLFFIVYFMCVAYKGIQTPWTKLTTNHKKQHQVQQTWRTPQNSYILQKQ